MTGIENMEKNFLAVMEALCDDSKNNIVGQDVDTLRQRLASLQTKHDLKVGDIVDWKEGLRNKKTPGPFVVVEVLDDPILDLSDNASSTYFREPIDIILGNVHKSGSFLCFHFDSRRFQPVAA